MKDKVKPEDIRERTFKFALRIISLTKALPKNEVNRVLVNQVLRSGTSVGANLEEALGSHTKAEFTNSTNIAKKEARETVYWLKLITESSGTRTKNRMKPLIEESEEITKILTASIKKLKNT
jgi:four helix bundle protein